MIESMANKRTLAIVQRGLIEDTVILQDMEGNTIPLYTEFCSNKQVRGRSARVLLLLH